MKAREASRCIKGAFSLFSRTFAFSWRSTSLTGDRRHEIGDKITTEFWEIGDRACEFTFEYGL